MADRRVLLAVIVGAHGVSGRVRLKTFTEEPASVAAYGPLSDEGGERKFDVTVTGMTKGGVIAELGGVRGRTAAEALKGMSLYVAREALPQSGDADEFYHADLVGLAAETPDGHRLGVIRAIHDFGAGPVLDVKPAKGKALLAPFTREAAPEIDLQGGRVIVVPPRMIDADDGERDATDEETT